MTLIARVLPCQRKSLFKRTHYLASAYAFHASPAPVVDSGVLTVDSLIAYLAAGNGGRVKHIAAHFGVSETKVTKIIEESDGHIVIGDRGWIRHDPLRIL